MIPPWVEYEKGALKSKQVSYDTYFKVEAIQEYHKAITMADFMEKFADKIWPDGSRTSFCYMERKKIKVAPGEVVKPGCNAKDGNPFGPFWDTYNIEFQKSEFYAPLHFDVHNTIIAKKWQSKYQPHEWPVLAFAGAPAHFPVQGENFELQKYVQWNDKFANMAKDYIKNTLPKGAFIGIHLRNGIDWIKACEHIKDSKQLFSSPQCLGYNNEKGLLFRELCFQTRELVIRQIKRVVKKMNNNNPKNQIKSVFVASDSNHLLPDLNENLERMGITAHKLEENNPHLDLAILGLSNHFIGNCISSFSAFVKRERDVRGFPSSFFAYPKDTSRTKHEEL